MKRFLVVFGCFMMLAVMSFAQPTAKGELSFGFNTPSTISVGTYNVVSVTRNMGWDAQYTIFGNWGLFGGYKNVAAKYAGLNSNTMDSMSNRVFNTKTLGLSYQSSELYTKGPNKGYGYYSLTKVGFQFGGISDRARVGNFSGQIDFRNLCVAQDFVYYLDRSKKKNANIKFSSISLKGSISIPTSKTIKSSGYLNENVYLPNLPSYFGQASITPKFKLWDMGSNTINGLVSGSYICRAYDFRPGANWFLIETGLSLDSKRVLAEIVSIKVGLMGNDFNNSKSVSPSVALSINVIGLLTPKAKKSTVTPVAGPTPTPVDE